MHLDSGRNYHIKFSPPKIDDKDDETGEQFLRRIGTRLISIVNLDEEN